MSKLIPVLLDGNNLSRLWATAFLSLVDRPGTEIAPLVVSLTGFKDGDPAEDADLRTALDKSLEENGKATVHTVANTIFPKSVWRACKYDRDLLFKTYKENIPRYKAWESRKNHRGLYFERLIAYGHGPHDGNQLEFIISEYNSRIGVRRSMLQASIFDPGRDHVRSAQLGFPCLQHVSFVPNDGGLIVNSFLTSRLEVDQCSVADWEKAILMGFAVWREVTASKGGTVKIDLDAQIISYEGCLAGKAEETP